MGERKGQDEGNGEEGGEAEGCYRVSFFTGIALKVLSKELVQPKKRK